jgi:heme A synthase
MTNGNGKTIRWAIGIIISVLVILLGGSVAANRAKIDKHDDVLRDMQGDVSYIRGRIDTFLEAQE